MTVENFNYLLTDVITNTTNTVFNRQKPKDFPMPGFSKEEGPLTYERYRRIKEQVIKKLKEVILIKEKMDIPTEITHRDIALVRLTPFYDTHMEKANKTDYEHMMSAVLLDLITIIKWKPSTSLMRYINET